MAEEQDVWSQSVGSPRSNRDPEGSGKNSQNKTTGAANNQAGPDWFLWWKHEKKKWFFETFLDLRERGVRMWKLVVFDGERWCEEHPRRALLPTCQVRTLYEGCSLELEVRGPTRQLDASSGNLSRCSALSGPEGSTLRMFFHF